MRVAVMVIAVILTAAVFAGGTLCCKGTQLLHASPSQQGPEMDTGDVNAVAGNLSDYYGFGEMEMVKLDWGIRNLKIVDLNADGRTDMVVANNIKARIELLIQKAAVGVDEDPDEVDPADADINAITPPTRYARHNIAVSQKIFSLVCGDLNSDTLPDLAFYGEPKGLYVILQNPAKQQGGKAGVLNWHTANKISIDDALVTSDALVCADLNNDGRNDLAMASRDAVYVLLQKDDGSLADFVKYPATSQIRGITTADLNGDGINDLVIVTNDAEKPVHVRFGFSNGQLGPQQQFFIDKPFQFDACNIDGSPGGEILTVDAVSGRLNCYAFAPAKQADADWPILFYPLAVDKQSSMRDLVLGDFDGDGLVDVIVSAPDAAEVVFYKQLRGIGLAEPVRFPAFADIASIAAADFDADGKAELAVLSVTEKVIGVSEFEKDRLSFPRPLTLVGEPLAMDLADIDASGSIDCVYISADANGARSLRIAYNSGDSADLDSLFEAPKDSEQAEPALKLKKLSSKPEAIRVIDVDQDGLSDVLVFVKYEAPLLVRQTERGKFKIVDSPTAQASLIKAASAGSIAVSDVDGKNGAELLLAQKNFARSMVFADSSRWTIIDQYNARSTDNVISAVAAFDIGGDSSGGVPAILLLDGQKGRLQILKAADDKTYRFQKELDVGKWAAVAHLKMLWSPLTGTQARSALLFDSDKFALITPPGGALQPRYLERRFIYETRIKDGAYGNFTAGDINSDGRADIVMVEYKRNHIEILTLDNHGKPVAAMRFKIFEQKSYRQDARRGGKFSVEPREMLIADVTNDGKADLVTLMHDRIIVYPQD